MRIAAAIALAALAACPPLAAGDLTERFHLSLDRVLSGGPPAYDDALILADVIPRHQRRFTDFSGDVSGRYLGAVASAAAVTGRPVAALDRIAALILEHQKPDGHFGDPFDELPGRSAFGGWLFAAYGANRDHMAMLWGNGRLLVGLLEYWELSRDPNVLAAARRLGDYLERVAPVFQAAPARWRFAAKGATGYICWTQTIEGLAALAKATGEKRFLTLAAAIAGRLERTGNQHSHGFLSSLRGLLALDALDPGAGHLERVEREWLDLVESANVMLPGTVPELFLPRRERDEGCSNADWLRLNLALWRRTRHPRYLAAAERSYFNGFSFGQLTNGDFGHRRFASDGFESGAVPAWWCCTLHGLRALPEVREAAFHVDGGTVHYDLPVDGRAIGQAVAVEAESALETSASVRLRIARAEAPFTLAVRVPEWASSVEVSDASAPPPVRNGYLIIERPWKAGDTVEFRYRMRTRPELDPASRTRAAIFHGPWLLAVDERRSPHFFHEPADGNRVMLPAPGADIQLQPAPPSDRGRFEVPAAHLLIDFRPGGYALAPQKAELSPLAESTGDPIAGRRVYWLPLEDAP